MRRKTAKEILTASFQELAAVKSIDKITIQEIVDNYGYSPATFYRHFKDKYDLIAWEHTRAVAEIVDQTGADDYQWKQTLYDRSLKEISFVSDRNHHLNEGKGTKGRGHCENDI